jgi:hypothetical protein
MQFIDKQNDINFSFNIDDGYIFVQSTPPIEGCTFYVNTFEHQEVRNNVTLPDTYITWFNISHKNFVILGVEKDKKLLFRKLILLQLELSLINKKDITFVVDKSLNMDIIKDMYEKLGKIVVGNYGDSYDTKYVVYLKNYLINIVYLINKMFFNYGYVLQDPNGEVFIMEKDNNSKSLIVDDLEIKNLEVIYDFNIT